jgi:hypothetical protein
MFSCFFEATRELQITVLNPFVSSRLLFQSSMVAYTDFQEALEKLFIALMQLKYSCCTLPQEGLEKYVKIK